MSTYFKHFGGINIKEVIEKTNWKIGIKDEIIDVSTAIEKQLFYITNGKDYLWIDTDNKGKIISFTSYASNDADFLIYLIGNTVCEHDYQEGIIEYYDDEELSEWIEENTFFEELEKVA
jgi:hypothetical protein